MATATSKLEIILTADNKAAGALKGVKQNLLGIGKVAAGALVGGFAVAGVAAVALGAKAAGAFINFEDQMNEVATLLPNLSKEAFGEMQDDVLDLSKETGRLTEEIIPALYQSISAGVPPDNVFEFMELAHKAALGGVTELETAVDGITSVVNAYGEELVDATQASDLMFTAVRLGKTDFNQLSSALFNVIPTAASLGVEFSDVTAALATITAAGTPTKVATTQIRAALVEASKGGTKLDTAIKELTGVSFPELIQKGESMPGIFQNLRESMPEQEFKDLFGSVEAVNAVLGITGPNFEKVQSAMAEMGNSAGATQAAYETMNSGLARVLEEIKANIAAAFIKVGMALAPIIRQVADNLMPALENLMNWFESTALPIVEQVIGAFQGLFENLASGMDPIEALKNVIMNLMITVFGSGVDRALEFEKSFDKIREAVGEFIDRVREVADPIVEWVVNLITLKDIFIAIGAVIAAVLIPAMVGLAVSMIQFVAPILLIVGAIALLRSAWENDFLGIKTMLVAVWEGTLKPLLTELKAWFDIHIPIAIQFLKDAWENTLLPAIETVVVFLEEKVVPIIKTLIEVWFALLKFEVNLVATFFSDVLVPAIQSVAEFFTTKLLPAIQTVEAFIKSKVIPIIKALVETWFENFKIGLAALAAFWNQTLLPAIQDVWSFIQNDIIPLFIAVSDLMGAVVGVALTALQGLWENVLLPALEKVWAFIQNDIIPIFNLVAEIINLVLGIALEKLRELWEDKLLPAITAVWDWIQTKLLPIFAELVDKIKDKLQPQIDGAIGLFNIFKNAINNVSGAIQSIIGFIKTLADRIANIQLPGWLTPGSPTPLELGLAGIGEEMDKLSRRSLPRFTTGLDILDGQGGANRFDDSTPEQHTHFHLSTNNVQASNTIIEDFELMQALAL